MIVSLRIPDKILKVLRETSEELGIKYSKLIKLGLELLLDELRKDESISLELKLKLFELKGEELRRREDEIFRQWKSFLRSHPRAYLLRDLNFNNISRFEKLKKLVESDERLKIAIESFLTHKVLITKQMEDLNLQKAELLKRVGKWHSFEELEEMIERDV